MIEINLVDLIIFNYSTQFLLQRTFDLLTIVENICHMQDEILSAEMSGSIAMDLKQIDLLSTRPSCKQQLNCIKTRSQ